MSTKGTHIPDWLQVPFAGITPAPSQKGQDLFPTGNWRAIRPVYRDKMPPCNNACGTNEKIQGYLDLVKRGKYLDAYALIKEDMNKVRKGLNFKGASFLMIYTPCQKGFVYETPRSIDLGRLVVECGLYPIWEWNNEKREYDYSFRPQSMRPVSEYLKLQGRFGHLHAEHIATLQRFANQQWQMMGVALPEALVRATDPKSLIDMASAEAAAAVAQTV